MNQQQKFWSGALGDKYTLKCQTFRDLTYLDGKKSDIIRRFFEDIPRDSSILELGCNMGNSLKLLKDMGFTDITGVDINKTAIDIATTRYPDLTFIHSSIEDYSSKRKFDIICTFGVLIHVDPVNIQSVMDKMKSLSNKYIFGYEYYAKDAITVRYPAHCWCADFPKMFDLKPVKVEVHELVIKKHTNKHVFYILKV